MDNTRPILLNVKDVENRVTFGRMHIWELQTAGRFPKSFKLRSRRAAWHVTDILSWMQQKIDQRTNSPQIRIQPNDRFITTKQVRALTSLSDQQIRRIEKRNDFPRRIQLSVQRVAWLEREVHVWIEEQK